MLDRRVFLLATATLAVPPAFAQPRSPDDPVVFLTAIYSRIAAGKGDSGGIFVFNTKAAKARYLSTSLGALWAKADALVPKGETGPIDFDPLTNSQDPNVKSFKVSPEKIEADRGALMVSLSTRNVAPKDPKDNSIHYDLVHEASGWRIDDIKGSSDGQAWSVRALLTDSLKH